MSIGSWSSPSSWAGEGGFSRTGRLRRSCGLSKAQLSVLAPLLLSTGQPSNNRVVLRKLAADEAEERRLAAPATTDTRRTAPIRTARPPSRPPSARPSTGRNGCSGFGPRAVRDQAAVALVSTGGCCSGAAEAIGIPSRSPLDNAASSLAIIARMRSHSFNTNANLSISSSVMPSASPPPCRGVASKNPSVALSG